MTVTTETGINSRTAPFRPLVVRDVEQLTDDSVAVTFDVPEELADEFAFAAGQALTLRRIVDGVEHRRTYSISSPVGSLPRIGVREIPDGLFSRWLVREVRPGDIVEVQRPSGSFRADPDRAAQHLCIAAGSGITPMLSIASSVVGNPDSSVTVLYGNRTTNTVMFAEELADLKNANHQRFDLIHVLSREARDVELFSGRLEGDRLRTILRELVPLDTVDHVWLCGPMEMLQECRTVLAELGVAAERIHYELFYVDAPPPQLRHADAVIEGETAALTVVLDGRNTTFAAPKTTTVLDSAQSKRPDMPFACKGGVCGTCRARVTSGEVEMARNYALEDAEVEQGFVLTCQSFPISDEVTVDYDA
ncbi:1,2-phenylacetyl-CoA epoxidase subunit PaaE [Flexivirga caeni]|uniref:Phenylacetate-CoA oxygenase/reductase subunit PaaK n=1 Tax=Flexivirga caeni TaxID=2294115 RepID=A0A3M9MKI1_9MICO|nr:1,2-phenylacetyl-CoA epoxidase subunit PaaE [Flexivirga caeni]RNI25393.1 phenylacetate-CoA oxygenase/reductase subunit PaaK [Flexivirga caeni]